MTSPASRLVCAGCGAVPDRSYPYPFRCPNAGREEDVDHVLRRELDLSSVRFPTSDSESNPFIRYRTLLHAYQVAMRGGLSDDAFCALVRQLDERVAAVDGHGFSVTPFARSAELSDALAFSEPGGVWVKDETRNVSGSHKARHLFGVLVYLEVAERLGLTKRDQRPELAIEAKQARGPAASRPGPAGAAVRGCRCGRPASR